MLDIIYVQHNWNILDTQYIIIGIHNILCPVNPLMPSGAFNICCPRDCVSRHNGGASGAPPRL